MEDNRERRRPTPARMPVALTSVDGRTPYTTRGDDTEPPPLPFSIAVRFAVNHAIAKARPRTPKDGSSRNVRAISSVPLIKIWPSVHCLENVSVSPSAEPPLTISLNAETSGLTPVSSLG
jgi:hypothetical protein